MPTLYRKYRPQSWQEVVGQNHVKLTLEREIETGRLAHAFLFSGPRGIGKTTMARLLAKSLNCEKRKEGESEPCGKCPSCQEIAESRAIDVLEIDAASHTGVDNVRENVIESARFLPAKGKFKVFIIDEAHMLSPGAFNALLKILEEPPAHVVFVLATTEAYKLPQTIISRCQHFDFKKVNIDEIVKRLKNISEEEKIKVDKKVLEQVAYRSEGCLRDAESLLGQIFSLGEKNIDEEKAGLILPRSDFSETAKLLELTAQGNLKEALLFLNKLTDEGVDLIRFTDDLTEFSRFLLLAKLGGDLGKISFALDENLLKVVSRLAKDFTTAKIISIIETFLKQKSFLRSSSIPQLPLEMALVALCGESPGRNAEKTNKSEKSDGTEKPAVVPTISVAASLPTTRTATEEPAAPLSLDFVREKWQSFLKRAQDHNHSLSFILKTSEPVGLEKRTLKIGVRFSFHQDKLREPKLRALMEKVLLEVMGQPLGVEAVLQENGAVDALADDLAEAFGGRVVE